MLEFESIQLPLSVLPVCKKCGESLKGDLVVTEEVEFGFYVEIEPGHVCDNVVSDTVLDAEEIEDEIQYLEDEDGCEVTT